MSIILNNIPLTLDADKRQQPMELRTFITTFGYNIDDLYIDKFWASIEHDQWIVVDYDMLRWIGYNCERDVDNKVKYQNLLLNNEFVLGEDFDLVSTVNPDDKRICDREDTFKQAIMLTQTKLYHH